MKNQYSQPLIEKIISRKNELNVYRVTRRYPSKLDPFRYEILILHNELGCSYGKIQQWLKLKNDISITTTAIRTRIIHWNKLINRGTARDTFKQKEK